MIPSSPLTSPLARKGTGLYRSRAGFNARPISEINITPFVDVMLVLLIVFMIVAPLLASGVAVKLPQENTEILPQSPQKPVTLTIREDGKIYLDEQEIAADLLAAALIEKIEQGSSDQLYLKADRALQYGAVVFAMARARESGFLRISLITEQKTPLSP